MLLYLFLYRLSLQSFSEGFYKLVKMWENTRVSPLSECKADQHNQAMQEWTEIYYLQEVGITLG